jgi:hypothetical protein
MEDLIREHASFLDAQVDRDPHMDRKIKSYLKNSYHEHPVQALRMTRRAVLCALLLILFVFVHSAWIGRVTRLSAVPTAADPYFELFQSAPVLDSPFSEGLQWER